MTKRNYGIDFLRILSMFMVVILHVLGQGGILFNAPAFSGHYFGSWFWEILCYGAVNCFAIISGFVAYTSKPKVSRLAELWLQTAFYALTFTAVFFLLFPDRFNISLLLSAVFPITRGHYWYISAYFGLYLLTPLLNLAIRQVEEKTGAVVLLSAFFFFTVLPAGLLNEPFQMHEGYSMIWLMLMYFVGGYLRKFDVITRVKSSTAWLMFGGCSVFTFGWYVTTLLLSSKISIASRFANTLVEYTSPTVVLAAVFLFIACAKLSFPKRIETVIGAFAPAALGVYLVHVCLPVWNYVIKDFAKGLLQVPAIVMFLLVPLCATAIYLVCTAIELLRIRLFRWWHIDEDCVRLEGWLSRWFDRAWNRIKK